MPKLNHIDFIISEDKYEKIKMRFYPKSSNMHSFNKYPPKTFDDVYKVYYSWAIMKSYNNSFSDSEENWSAYERVFCFDCDECSAITNLSYVIRHIIRYKRKSTKLLSFGQPGSVWNIFYEKVFDFQNDDYDSEWAHIPERDYLRFEVWNNYTDIGYMFNLPIKKAHAFCEYIDSINQHMLENGDPI